MMVGIEEIIPKNEANISNISDSGRNFQDFFAGLPFFFIGKNHYKAIKPMGFL